MRMSRTTSTIARLALLAATVLLVTGCGDEGANSGYPTSGSSASVASSDVTGNGGSSLADRIFGTSSAPSMVANDRSIDDSITGVYGTVPGADSVVDPSIDAFDENPLAAAESDFDDLGGMNEFDYAAALDAGDAGGLMTAGWEEGAGSSPTMAAYDDMSVGLDDDPALEDDFDDDPMMDEDFEDDPMLDEDW